MTRKALRIAVVNGGAANGWGQARSIAILNSTIEKAQPDIILGCEFFNITQDNAGLDPAVWRVLHDPSSEPKAGSLMAVRRARASIGWYAMRVGSPAGYSIRTRYIWVARVCVDGQYFMKVVAGHAPPKRAWALWPTFMASVRMRDADLAGADWNKLAPAVERALGRKTRMGGTIVGAAVRNSIPATRAKLIDVGSDHAAVLTVLYG